VFNASVRHEMQRQASEHPSPVPVVCR